MKCPKCGTENNDGAKFCKGCGGSLQSNPSSDNSVSQSKGNNNTLIICATILLAIIVIAGAFILLNNGSDDSNGSNDVVSDDDSSVSEDADDESSSDSSESSTPRLGSKENPKTTADHPSGSEGDLNPYYGDYYYIDGTLYRDDNKYLGGAGTYTYISGKDPYADDSSSSSSEKHWYGECTTHGWVQLNSDKHCPQCIKEGRDPRVLKNSIVYQ